MRIAARGFTLIELVGTMVIVGILAVVALPRLANVGTFDVRAASDEIAAMIRYAQKLAIAQQRLIYVNVDTGSGQACLNLAAVDFGGGGSCPAASQPLPSPFSRRVGPSDDRYLAPGASGRATLSSSAASFAFTASGAPTVNGVTVTVSGEGVSRTVVVAAETGYVHVQ